MMAKRKFAILDSSDHLGHFCLYMKDEYIPVTLNDKTKAALEAAGIDAIGILDHLNRDELKDITKRAFAAADALLLSLDAENRAEYLKIFGTADIRFMDATIGYLFKRFVIASLRLIYGIEAIARLYKIEEIAYLHDGNAHIICGTKKERGFIFPDDITWKVMQFWSGVGRFKLNFIKTGRRNPYYGQAKRNLRVELLNLMIKARTFLYPFKKLLLSRGDEMPPCSQDKKSLLFLTPLYDLGPLAGSGSLMRRYNVLIWDPDGNRDGYKQVRAALSFNAEGFQNGLFLDRLDLKKLAIPLIMEFYDKKFPDIFAYWKDAEGIFTKYDTALVLWGNSPHRYPHGILKEFFRLKGVPICGMQHGGLTGSNELGESIFESDLKNCDHYFSYGFDREDLGSDMAARGPSIIPVGSTAIQNMISACKDMASSHAEKFDLIFPVSLAVGEFYYENEFSRPRLFEFQKDIIDVMAAFYGKKILLKFPVGTYHANPIGIYIEKRYPGRFTIIDHISFTDCLRRYKAGAIVIEEQSTPLNEALVTENDIIVYNDQNWAGLTERAHRLLSKRAMVCDGEEAFLKTIRAYLEGAAERKDPGNREFLERYCVYKGDPEKNIEDAIISLTADKKGAGTKDLVYAG